MLRKIEASYKMRSNVNRHIKYGESPWSNKTFQKDNENHWNYPLYNTIKTFSCFYLTIHDNFHLHTND